MRFGLVLAKPDAQEGDQRVACGKRMLVDFMHFNVTWLFYYDVIMRGEKLYDIVCICTCVWSTRGFFCVVGTRCLASQAVWIFLVKYNN